MITTDLALRLLYVAMSQISALSSGVPSSKMH